MDHRLLTLVAPKDQEAIARAAREVGLEPRAMSTTSALLGALSDGPYRATVISLDDDHVDAPVVERLATTASAGALVLVADGASLEAALLRERVGAVALLHRPLDGGALEALLARLTSADEVLELPRSGGGEARRKNGALIGRSRAMAEVFELIARVAKSTSTVLVTGESGTGKEVVARTLHAESARRDGPFVAVNCAAIPEHLLESELFGHERGAFTGAVARRIGRFERADGGTLFLDEIGDMSMVLQAKVLRVLEERQVERVGGGATESVDVRVIAATNARLSEAIAEGRFREDLYYRLGVVEIELPALRQRGDDIRLLALHFAAHFAHRHERDIGGITLDAMRRIEQAPWPGNVRELRNVMDRAVLLTPGPTIDVGALRLDGAAPHAAATPDSIGAAGYPPTASLALVEASHIDKVLRSVGDHIGDAADILGIHRNTLSRKIREYDLRTDSPAGRGPQ